MLSCPSCDAYIRLSLDTGVRSVDIIADVQFSGGLAMHTGIWAMGSARWAAAVTLFLAGSCCAPILSANQVKTVEQLFIVQNYKDDFFSFLT